MVNHGLTTKQLAKRWGLEPQTIRSWRLKGYGPQYVRLGDRKRGRVVYRLEDIQAWEQARTFTSTSEESASGPLV